MASKRTSEKKIIVTPTGAAAAPARRKSVSKRIVHTTAEVTNTPVFDASEVEEAPVAAAMAEPVAASAGSLSDAVARLAYSYWEARGYQGGSPEEDWLRAEQELLAK